MFGAHQIIKYPGQNIINYEAVIYALSDLTALFAE